MLIEMKKQTTEAIEIKTPFYCRTSRGFHKITDAGDLINVMSSQITIWRAENMFLTTSIREVLEEAVECTEGEFNEAAYSTIRTIGTCAELPLIETLTA
jgi:hypothetical protein